MFRSKLGGFSSIVAFAAILALLPLGVVGLGSMAAIAVAYGENGPVFCELSPDRGDQSPAVTCFGADASVVYGSPFRLPLLGLAAGDGFVCGLLADTRQPYCWGSNTFVKIGVPQPMTDGAMYSQLSAGDDHLCALRLPSGAAASVIDCWGYNMTAQHAVAGEVSEITAGSAFNCGLLAGNRTVFCWGDETGSDVIRMTPPATRFRTVAAGGFHVCGILEKNGEVLCWGRSLESMQRQQSSPAPKDPMLTVVGGRFHSCGIKSVDGSVVCWGFALPHSVPPPPASGMTELSAGDYFTCGVPAAAKSQRPLCWGSGGPWSMPMAVSPGDCSPAPCGPGYYDFNSAGDDKVCGPEGSRVCLPCSAGCPAGETLSAPCNATADRTCELISSGRNGGHNLFKLQIPIFVAEVVFAVVLVTSVTAAACIYVQHKLGSCRCSGGDRKEPVRVRPDMGSLRIRRARAFTFRELETATGGFGEGSVVGKGSFSCVFKGVLGDGTAVAVKRAVAAKKSSREFHNELDLLSRLNHAHLLNLLGYCDDGGGERLLVYEFMEHGSLYQHLHCRGEPARRALDWVRRVTIAVQAARGIEYLHGYACPPVIHRDIKSSNILIDGEHNARVADFGLSLFGPADSGNPLSELPAGTLGYLDPEYYRLHYLTTKSDVYSFGVLLLEILSGRKAIDMQFEEGNIVEWAVPMIKSGQLAAVLDPVLAAAAPEVEALKKVAAMACKCVRMRGKERPSMEKVTTALERALALLMGSPCEAQPILPTEVVLGSSRMQKKGSMRSSTNSDNDGGADVRSEYHAPSWITFPSLTSSQRRKSEASEADVEGRNQDSGHGAAGDGLQRLEEEIGPASPQEDAFLKHNI